MMKTEINKLTDLFAHAMSRAKSPADLEAIRVDFLGRKAGKLTVLLRGLKDLPIEEKRAVGPLANAAREQMETALTAAEQRLAGAATTATDLTLPGLPPMQGHLHPRTLALRELVQIFRSMGFMVAEGFELETEFYNFEGLNIPAAHPARDIQDTFFIKTPITRAEKHQRPGDRWVMRTHTSSMQVRIMEEHEPPLRCVIPGRVFRNEATDASHEHTFYQLEGFVVDTDVTIGQLVWTLREIFRQFYRQEVKIRLRPGYFPFTEPSYEPDLSCTFCQQQDPTCRVCKGTGWVEMGGSGMIHPNVLAAAGYPAGKYTGFAFGMGPDRLAMLKYGIPDIRLFAGNDLRILEQF